MFILYMARISYMSLLHASTATCDNDDVYSQGQGAPEQISNLGYPAPFPSTKRDQHVS